MPYTLSNTIGPSAVASTGSLVITCPPNLSDLKDSSSTRKARVLYDYDAANSTELSLLADEVSESCVGRKLPPGTPCLPLEQSVKPSLLMGIVYDEGFMNFSCYIDTSNFLFYIID